MPEKASDVAFKCKETGRIYHLSFEIYHWAIAALANSRLFLGTVENNQ
jgi:hypothetical protein